MVTQAAVRHIAAALPGAHDATSPARLVFEVGGKGFAWTYYGRVAPKTPKVPFFDVLAVCCTLESKAMLIEAAPEIYFTDDHYRGYPAVLVRLNKVSTKELRALLTQACALKTPKQKLKRAPKTKTPANRTVGPRKTKKR